MVQESSSVAVLEVHQEAMEAMQAMEHLREALLEVHQLKLPNLAHSWEGILLSLRALARTAPQGNYYQAVEAGVPSYPVYVVLGLLQLLIDGLCPASEGLAQVLLEATALRSRLQYPEHAAGLLDMRGSSSDVLVAAEHREHLDPSAMQSLGSFLERLEQREQDKAVQKGGNTQQGNVAVQGETAQGQAGFLEPPEQCGPSPAKKGKTEEGDQDQVGDQDPASESTFAFAATPYKFDGVETQISD